MFRRIVYRAFSDVWSKGAFFLITVAAAHRLSQQAFGIFSLATTLGWIVGVTTDFGIQLHVARAVARQPERATAILWTWMRIRIWTAAAAIGVIAAGLLVRAPAAQYAVPLFFFTLLYVGNGLIEFLHYFYRGLGRSDVESTLTICQRAATLVCALAVLTWRPDLTLLAIALLVPVTFTFAYSLGAAIRLGRNAAGTTADGAAEPSPRLAHTARWQEFRHDVLPIGAGIVLSALYFRIDVFLVQLWSGAESVALYNAVFRLVEALRLFPAAALAVVLPSLCRAGDTRPLMRVAVAVTVFACATTLMLTAAAGWIIPFVYGARYADAVPAFRILLFSFPLFSLNYALTHQLIGWDGQRSYAAIAGVALAANVALNAWLIPARGIEGAAWATLLTEAILTAGCSVALGARNPARAAGTAPAPAAS